MQVKVKGVEIQSHETRARARFSLNLTRKSGTWRGGEDRGAGNSYEK